MAPNYNLSDVTSVTNYASKTQAILKINSVVTDLHLEFPAFLTDFSQNFDSTWNTEDVFGRMDPIATFQSTKRTISLGFDIPSATSDGAKTNLQKTQDLVKMVYPVYKEIGGTSVLSKPPIVRIQFANLLKGVQGEGLLGWISGLSWKPVMDMGMFASNNEFYPKVISISFSFNALHEMTLNQESLDKWPFGV
jgi:hypothetical protein